MSDWKKEEDALDELLNNMPKFTDHRLKEDVYNRVKAEIDASKERSNKRNAVTKISKWMPLVASIASILVITFLVSYYLNDQSSKSDMASMKMEQKATVEESMRKMDVQEKAVPEENMGTESTNEMTSMTVLDNSTIDLVPFKDGSTVYAEDVKEDTVFHFSLMENALTVPITIVIPKEKIEQDFPNGNPSSLDMYQHYASSINEAALGFEEYHPYKGYFSAEGTSLKHYLPVGHGYDMASGTAVPYFVSLKEIFTDFEKLFRVNEDGSPINWDQVGILKEPSDLAGQFNYFKYEAQSGEIYLATNFGATYNSLSEAVMAMKDAGNDLFVSVIPSDVNYSYEENKGIATIQFEKPLDLSKMEAIDATRLIEAFALTGASFDSQVQLTNVVQKEWERYDLTKPLPVPIGPNGFTIE